MIDTLIQAAQTIPLDKAIGGLLALGFGSGAGIALIGRLFFNYVNTRHCPEHTELSNNVLITKNNVEWLVDIYKKERGL